MDLLESKYHDFLIKTASASALDQTLSQLPMLLAHVMDQTSSDGTCWVRVLSGVNFFKFVMKNQGYGEILEEHFHNNGVLERSARYESGKIVSEYHGGEIVRYNDV
jgi:hypothetical protein